MTKKRFDYYHEPMSEARALALALLVLEAEIPAAKRCGQRGFAKECVEAAAVLRELKAAQAQT